MRKILTSLFTIAVVGALTVGGTLAVFSDRETIAGNTVATGDFDLTLDKSEGKPYNIENAYPGFASGWDTITISNGGPAEFEAYLGFNKTSGSNLLYEKLHMTVKTPGEDTLCNEGEEPDLTEAVVYNGPLGEYGDAKLVSALNFYADAVEGDGSGEPADNMSTEHSLTLCQQLSLPEDVGNEVMGKTVTFDEFVDAMQDND